MATEWCASARSVFIADSKDAVHAEFLGRATKIFTICMGCSGDVGTQLQKLLQVAPQIKLICDSYAVGTDSDFYSVLSKRLSEFQPALIVMCLPCGIVPEAQSVFEAIRNIRPDLSIVVVLEAPDFDDLHRYIQMGAADFCLMPLRLEDLIPRLLRWSLPPPDRQRDIVRDLTESVGLKQILGQSELFVAALSQIPKIARCDQSVLITGETGTGKEMCARAIHQLGPRCRQPFVPVNCGAIPSELVENELFGHAPGAFTGASSSTHGLVYEADGGTLFLDEIDSLPLAMQVKFLRFLQDRQYRPLGARKACQADVRFIAACNVNLEELVRAGRFRADLFYRLNVLPLKLPPLRARQEDIPLMARHFVLKHSGTLLTTKQISQPALDKLMAYSWPGNVRELENIIERAVVLSEQPVIAEADICLPAVTVPVGEMSFKTLKARAVAEFETTYVRRLLTIHEGNINKAARAAKKNRRAFWQLMRKHNISSRTKSVLSRIDLSYGSSGPSKAV